MLNSRKYILENLLVQYYVNFETIKSEKTKSLIISPTKKRIATDLNVSLLLSFTKLLITVYSNIFF